MAKDKKLEERSQEPEVTGQEPEAAAPPATSDPVLTTFTGAEVASPWTLARAALEAFTGSEKEALRWIVQQLSTQLGSAPPDIRNQVERIVRELEFCC